MQHIADLVCSKRQRQLWVDNRLSSQESPQKSPHLMSFFAQRETIFASVAMPESLFPPGSRKQAVPGGSGAICTVPIRDIPGFIGYKNSSAISRLLLRTPLSAGVTQSIPRS
ncbi:MAG: hypothetical protein WBZ31_03935 [Thiobacillus sp.]